jgi:hypothetical protein
MAIPRAAARDPLVYAAYKELHVWDREFGFLREMLVAPVSRMSLMSVTGFGKPG